MKKIISVFLAVLMSLSAASVSAKAEFLPRDGWTAEVTSQRGNNIGNILDGDSSTYWHSNYTNEG